MIAPRKCLLKRCGRSRHAEQIFCHEHWFELPQRLRDDIWRSYRALDQRRSRQLVREALNWFRDRGQGMGVGA